MPELIRKKKKMSSFEMIAFGFAGVILLGAIILMLPISSSAGVVTPFDKTLFTATSAVCVTGLVVVDTGSYWSAFGQAVILLLIQTGGLGVITVVASFSMVSGRKISLMQRSTMQDAISAPKVGGIVRLTKFILQGTFLIEFSCFLYFAGIMDGKESGCQSSIRYRLFAMQVLTYLERRNRHFHL